MDPASMIFGAVIAGIFFMPWYPWAKLKRLKQLEDAIASGKPDPTA